MGETDIKTSEKITLIQEAAKDKKSDGPVLVDLQGRSSVTDYYFVCSGQSPQQINAIAEEIERILKKKKVYCLRKEGTVLSEWVLLDYGDVVIHILSEESREKYDLETLWKEFLERKTKEQLTK